MKNPKKGGPKESEFKKFVKKRAPIYLAVAALVVVFVVPELTKAGLESHFPEDMPEPDRHVLYTLMDYRGPDAEGLSLQQALTNRINEEYPDENVFDSKKTTITIQVLASDAPATSRVLLDFESYKGKLDYSWDVNMDTGIITGNNPRADHIVDVVNFYD